MNERVLFSSMKVQEMNVLAQSIHPNLLFSYYYNPKFFFNQDSEKERFWLALTNVYTLYFDCSSFLFRGTNGGLLRHLSFYLSQHDGQMRCAQDLLKFVYGLQELRSWYCHNMHEELNYQMDRVYGLGKDLNGIFFADPLRVKEDKVDYKNALAYLEKQTNEMIYCMERAFTLLKEDYAKGDAKAQSIVEKWNEEIIYWYANQQDFYSSAIRKYYDYLYHDLFRRRPNRKYFSAFQKKCSTLIGRPTRTEASAPSELETKLLSYILTSKQAVNPITYFMEVLNLHQDDLRNFLFQEAT
ncbi:hypothetical protein [Paenibacillus qinlingensis]|uniref:hypothetical protein n=1 Tax=Paenibacillus qinlingensis TaxID=1837343 RepID=UPI00156675C0|nr:hypothetical protein [Paenibacillus qinlingensis]NQX63554.1 hypothetical protein [Paenibacillus qinlingensis]